MLNKTLKLLSLIVSLLITLNFFVGQLSYINPIANLPTDKYVPYCDICFYRGNFVGYIANDETIAQNQMLKYGAFLIMWIFFYILVNASFTSKYVRKFLIYGVVLCFGVAFIFAVTNSQAYTYSFLGIFIPFFLFAFVLLVEQYLEGKVTTSRSKNSFLLVICIFLISLLVVKNMMLVTLNCDGYNASLNMLLTPFIGTRTSCDIKYVPPLAKPLSM